MRYIPVTKNSRGHAVAMENLHSIFSSAVAGKLSGKFDKAFSSDKAGVPLYQVLKEKDLVPLDPPRITFGFEKALTEEEEMLLAQEGLAKMVIRNKGKVYVGKITAEAALLVDNWDLDMTIDPVGGSLSPAALEAFSVVKAMVTVVAQALEIACDRHTKAEQAVKIIEYGEYKKYTITTYNVSDQEEIVASREVSANDTSLDDMSEEFLALRTFGPIYGEAKDVSGYWKQGLFCPFEPNYSGVDVHGLSSFISEFSSILVDSDNMPGDEQKAIEFWTDQIAPTMEGELLAHMMGCLTLCKRVNAQPFFIMSGGLYEGTVIHGAREFKIQTAGGRVVEGMGTNELKEDIEKYAFHTSTLKKILLEFGLPEGDARRIKSMRQLRNHVFGQKGGAIEVAVKARVTPLLGLLNFRERPEPVHINSITKFLDSIHPTTPVPLKDTEFLDRDAFFSTDTIETNLSMFGRFPPSPRAHGASYLCAVSPSSTTQKVSGEPTNIQLPFKTASVALGDWKDFLSGGRVVFPAEKLKRGRKFLKEDKSILWSKLCNVAAAGIASKKGEVAQNKGGEKRKRDDLEDDSKGEGSKRKRFTFGSMGFGAFGAGMDI
jgi:hypothetical protein